MEAITTPPCQDLVQRVLQCHPGQQLYLLGSTTVQQKTNTVFRHDHPTCTYTAHYYLLSLVRVEGLREPQPDRLAAVQDTIENTLAPLGTATVLVLNLATFNRWLMQGHPFALTIHRKAVLLHDAGYALSRPGTGELANLPDPEMVYQKGLVTARHFFAGAEFYRQRKETAMAMFMLHQCTEQCLRALLQVTTGYCPHTHNIDKLVRYCSMAVHKLTEIFHSRTPRQEKLYRLLRNSYIDARYKLLVVSDDEAREVTGKVKTLMKLLREYGQRISRPIATSD